MKITFITTIKHNVGDDFVRDGIKYLLESYFETLKLEYQYIHKHVPVTVRKGFGHVRSLAWSERIEKYIPKSYTPDKINMADVVIQSGAPLYWLHSKKNASFKAEWYKPLIENRLKTQKKRKILLNIGVGACQEYDSNGMEFLSSPEFIHFVKDFYDVCDLTTVRDELSYHLLSNLNLKAPKLPCPSIFSSDYHQINSSKQDYLVLNYMAMGGHYDFGKQIDCHAWKNRFLSFYNKIKEKEKIVFACHDKKELSIAKQMFPDADLFFSKNYVDYIKLYSKAKFGIVNRVHAGFQLASNLNPAFIVGSDSRAKMASEIGLDSSYVNEVTDELLLSKYYELLNLTDSKRFYLTMKELKTRTKEKYLKLFDEVFKHGEAKAGNFKN